MSDEMTASEKALERARQVRIEASREETSAFANYVSSLQDLVEAERVHRQTTLDYIESDRELRAAQELERVARGNIKSDTESAAYRADFQADEERKGRK